MATGTNAARHGTGDADLTIMLAAHDAFRRDLVRLAKAAAFADLPDPARRAAVGAGWETFKQRCTCTTPPRTRSSGPGCGSGSRAA